MKCLPRHPMQMTAGAHPIIVTLIASDAQLFTQTGSPLCNVEKLSSPLLPTEAEVRRHAAELEQRLNELRDHPAAIRFWGLNE